MSTPIECLSSDVLSLIFLYTIDSSSTWLWGPPAIDISTVGDNTNRTLWTLMQVCSTWRVVLRSEHRFWNRIRIFVGNSRRSCNWKHADGRQEGWYERVLSCLNNSIYPCCNHRLQAIEISVPGFSIFLGDDQDHAIRLIRDLVRPQLPTLSKLILRLPKSIIRSLYDLPPDLFTALEHLELSVTDDMTTSLPDSTYHSAPIFRDATSLRTLVITSDVNNFALPVEVPWGQLTEVAVNLFHWASALSPLDIVFRCLTCRKLSISIKAFYRGKLLYPKIGCKTFPHLQHLSLQGVPSTFLDALILSNLIVFCFRISHEDNFYLNTVVSMLERSECSPTLRTFFCTAWNRWFQGGPDPEWTTVLLSNNTILVHLITLLPCVVELHMQSFEFPADLFLRISQADLLPHLTMLLCSLNIDNIKFYEELVANRCQRGFETGTSLNMTHRTLHYAVGYISGKTKNSDLEAVNRRLRRTHGLDFIVSSHS